MVELGSERQLVPRNELLVASVLGDDDGADDTARATVAGHGVSDSLFHQCLGLVLSHALLELVIDQA